MADCFLVLRSVEVQAVRDIRDQNHRRICLVTLRELDFLLINLLTSG